MSNINNEKLLEDLKENPTPEKINKAYDEGLITADEKQKITIDAIEFISYQISKLAKKQQEIIREYLKDIEDYLNNYE